MPAPTSVANAETPFYGRWSRLGRWPCLYAHDARAGYRPLKGLAKVLAIFEARKDDWGLAYWFSSANSFLGGKRPQDLLGAEPERVASAAEDELAGVAHG